MTTLHIFSNINIKHVYILGLFLIYAIGSLLVYRKIFSDPELKKFFLDSLRESSKNGGCEGKPSGKSLTAFLLSNIIGISTIIAVIYAPNHLLPEYFLISVLTFIASLYGISMASKYFTGGNGNGSSNGTTTQDTSEEEKKKKEEENKNDVG